MVMSTSTTRSNHIDVTTWWCDTNGTLQSEACLCRRPWTVIEGARGGIGIERHRNRTAPARWHRNQTTSDGSHATASACSP
eukprot:879902-Prorocentrum_minimum.AAC.1